MLKLKSLSLYKKILLSILLASFVFLSIFTLVFFYTNEHLESQLLDVQVSSELQSIQQRLIQTPGLSLPRTAHLSVYLKSRETTDPLPDFIKNLKPGVYHEVENNSFSYQITVADFSGDIIYVLYDITIIEQSDDQLSIVLFVFWLVFLVIITIFSIALSRILSRPIQRLSDEVSLLNPDQRGVQLSNDFNDDEIGQIAKAFDLYLDKMDDYVQKHMAFSAMASHELRSPLTIVQTSADLIACLHDDKATLDHVEKIQRSSTNMADLIHALLYVTRDDESQNELQSFVLSSVIEQIETLYAADIRAKKITINNLVDTDISLQLHETLINVVLTNLIKNAIKFSENSEIKISYSAGCLNIVDQGLGIKDDDINHVFDFKYKGHNSQGYGIGLYVSKLICDHQGWTLSLFKNADSGVTAQINFNQA